VSQCQNYKVPININSDSELFVSSHYSYNNLTYVTTKYYMMASNIMTRAHSFPRAAEFRDELQNLPFATEFYHFRRILRN